MALEKIAEGKTKEIWSDPARPNVVTIQSKDDLTAGDGAKHDIMSGKAAMANQTTCNNFRFLRRCGVATSFLQQLDATSFEAEKCVMIPLEVVIRREAHGSFLKREPHLSKGHLFPRLRVEFYLKTADKVWNGLPLEKDDPLMKFSGIGTADLYRPDLPLAGAKPFLTIKDPPLDGNMSAYNKLAGMARRVFLPLEKAWQLQGRRLVDMKVEFGTSAIGQVLLSDVIDNDSWRVVEDGSYIDKQIYRDGAALDEVAARYARVQELTSQFSVPKQRLIIWRGSDSDNLDVIHRAFESIHTGSCELCVMTCSMHKKSQYGLQRLNQMVQERPDSVIIACVGRSNGAGPTLAAHTNVPVITVPVGYREFPNDIWSSLRAPSHVPVMTVLEPENAVLAALQILAARNPALYAAVRLQLEDRWADV